MFTEKEQIARTDFEVTLSGENAGVDLISRSVARGKSHQEYRSAIVGDAPCTGHSECDAIIAEERQRGRRAGIEGPSSRRCPDS